MDTTAAGLATPTGTGAKSLNFRPPSTSTASANSSFTIPSMSFMSGPWYVTHSTLPMWKKNKNVIITYTALEAGAIDDLVEYNPIDSNKKKTVTGVDQPDAKTKAAYNWRGKGWLKIASSHWQVLGHGEEEDGWMVTFFDKSIFTPAGIDIYARRKGGLSLALIQSIRREMKQISDQQFQKQADEIFEIKHEW